MIPEEDDDEGILIMPGEENEVAAPQQDNGQDNGQDNAYLGDSGLSIPSIPSNVESLLDPFRSLANSSLSLTRQRGGSQVEDEEEENSQAPAVSVRSMYAIPVLVCLLLLSVTGNMYSFQRQTQLQEQVGKLAEEVEKKTFCWANDGDTSDQEMSFDMCWGKVKVGLSDCSLGAGKQVQRTLEDQFQRFGHLLKSANDYVEQIEIFGSTNESEEVLMEQQDAKQQIERISNTIEQWYQEWTKDGISSSSEKASETEEEPQSCTQETQGDETNEQEEGVEKQTQGSFLGRFWISNGKAATAFLVSSVALGFLSATGLLDHGANDDE
jgi:hypothetical protein